MFTQFYNESIRKMVIGFGSLFNDIRVVRRMQMVQQKKPFVFLFRMDQKKSL